MRVIQIIIIIINNLLSVELTITSPKQCDSNSRQLIWSQFSSANSAWRLHYLISKAHRAAGPTKPIILPRMENECWLNPGLTNRLLTMTVPPTNYHWLYDRPLSINGQRSHQCRLIQWNLTVYSEELVWAYQFLMTKSWHKQNSRSSCHLLHTLQNVFNEGEAEPCFLIFPIYELRR